VKKLNPITIKRLKRFRQLKRGWWSFLLLVVLYLLTLGAELFCNARPLLMRHEGKWYFPAFRFYPENAFVKDGTPHQADYLALDREGAFAQDFVLWAPVKNDPYRIVPKDELTPSLLEIVRLLPQPRVASLTLKPDLTITKATGLETLWKGDGAPEDSTGRALEELWQLSDELTPALAPRWAGQAVPSYSVTLIPQSGVKYPPVELVFAAADTPRAGGRKTLRVRALEVLGDTKDNAPRIWKFAATEELPASNETTYTALTEELRKQIADARQSVRKGELFAPVECTLADGRLYKLTVEREEVRFPFRPVTGHWMGIDNAGRDVFARIFYALRIALNFGLLLVLFSMAGGTFVGILQGYRGGLTDLLGQRFIEIWSAMPFLYVMILMGSIYGAGFTLLLVCYALFNWIGISHYMRAEAFRLRKMPFVEAARCLGLSGWQIAFKHILPNALVPLVTLFPFSLVGAIGSLAALDYLGFGLPVPTPSLGEMLSQAQSERAAWWLTLFPSLALFAVMLLAVFVGEGIRNAFDPRRQQRLS